MFYRTILKSFEKKLKFFDEERKYTAGILLLLFYSYQTVSLHCL